MNLQNRLQDAIRELPQAEAPVMPEKIVDWVRQIPFHEIVAADEACEQFAMDHNWPPVANNVLAQIHLRLECALSLVESGMAPDASIPEEERLDILLLKFWHGKGIEWIEYTYAQN